MAEPRRINASSASDASELSKRLVVHQGVIDRLRQDLKNVNVLLVGIVFVFFVALAGLFVAVDGMLIEHYNSKAASYQDLIQKIDHQGEKVDMLAERIAQQGVRLDVVSERLAARQSPKTDSKP